MPALTVAVTGQTQIRGSPVPPTMNPPENAEHTNRLSQGSGSGISTSRCGSGSLSTAEAAARQNRTRVLSPPPDFSQEKLQGSLRQSPRSCHSFSWRCQEGCWAPQRAGAGGLIHEGPGPMCGVATAIVGWPGSGDTPKPRGSGTAGAGGAGWGLRPTRGCSRRFSAGRGKNGAGMPASRPVHVRLPPLPPPGPEPGEVTTA